MKIVFEYKDFWSNFNKTSKNFPIFSADISRFLLRQANLSLRACLAMCLIFRENPGSRAYKRVAYKKKCVLWCVVAPKDARPVYSSKASCLALAFLKKVATALQIQHLILQNLTGVSFSCCETT